MAIQRPSISSFFPSGKSLADWENLGLGLVDVSTPKAYDRLVTAARISPESNSAQLVKFFGSPEAYLKAYQGYTEAYTQYALDVRKESGNEAAIAQTEQTLQDVKAKNQAVNDAIVQRRQDNYNNVRSQLENQYNNLVKFDSRLAYQGRSSDLPTIFNQQTNQLVDAGVTDISKLRVQGGQLINLSTGKPVTTSNLNGQVYVDRDTGVQKWGDIFSGVKGGANYGIQTAQDGSVVLFPAWEKTKSPIAQIGLGGLESVITPILTVAGAIYGAGDAGSVIGASLGAGAGSTAGQYLASGEIDWENVAKSAALAGAGTYVGGLLSGGEAAAPAMAEAGATAATSTAVPGSFQAALPDLGVQTAATTAGATAVPGSFAAALPGLLAPVNVASSFPLEVGQTFTPAPGSFQEALPGLGVETQASAGGFTAAPGSFQAALPSLGVASFPSLAMNPIISPSALPAIDAGATAANAATAGTAGGLSTAEAVLATSALAGGAKQQPQAYRSGYGGGGQVAGVDASGLLALLQGRAGVPGVSSLIAPVVNSMTQPQSLLNVATPQYQPLTSLLG